MSSILTNNAAMVALQTLKSINNNLAMTQDAISTGKSISSAKDGSAIWAISKVMESDVAGFEAIEDQLAVGQATVGVAIAGAEQIVDLMEDMKTLAVNATSETSDFGKIDAEIFEKANQINGIIAAAQFNGVNLLATDVDGAGGTSMNVLASLDRSGTTNPTANNITVSGIDLQAGLTTVTAYATGTITTAAQAITFLDNLETDLQAAVDGAAQLGAISSRLDDQSNFVGKLVDSMRAGIGALVDADMEEASARLQALQTQQQLGIQALSIANQAPQNILSLFR